MRIAAVAAVSLLLGALSGYLVARPAEQRFNIAHELLSCETGNTGMTLRALRAFRAGKPDDGILLLETGLSLHAVVLDEWLRELQPSDPTAAEKLLRAMAAYRSEHPFTSEVPEADRNVEAIFASYSSR